MRLPTMAVGARQSTAAVSVFSYGPLGQAVASLLSASGQPVVLLDGTTGTAALPKRCQIHAQNKTHNATTVSLEVASDTKQCIKQSQAILVCLHSTEYGDMCEDLAPALSSGQTLLIVGAAFGAALEVASRLTGKRGDLSLNIVEIAHPFESYALAGDAISLFGVKDQLVIAGRSLNETRTGLSLAGHLFNGLVPASNSLERGFTNIGSWQQTAALLFTILSGGSEESALASVSAGADAHAQAKGGIFAAATQKQPAAKDRRWQEVATRATGNRLPAATLPMPLASVLSTLRTEMHALARAFGVNRLPESEPFLPVDLPPHMLKDELSRRIIEEFIILSNLARLVYMPLPMLESVIELACVVTGLNLRKEGRDLSDLGLSGLDVQEIIEHVSA